MKVALYIRVSTGKQELDNQLLPLQEFAKRRDFEVVRVYKDTASGKSSERDAFREMLADAHKRMFSAIVVWALDRLSREGMFKTINLLEHLNKIGVGVVSYTEPYLNTTDELVRNVLIALLSTLAKAEREKISERTKAGLVRARNNGKRLGRPPLPTLLKERAGLLVKKGQSIRETAMALKTSPSFVFRASRPAKQPFLKGVPKTSP